MKGETDGAFLIGKGTCQPRRSGAASDQDSDKYAGPVRPCSSVDS